MLSKFTNSVTGKMFLSGFLILLLWIPLLMVGNLVHEREARSRSVQKEIASKWGDAQNLSGPLLRFKLTRYIGKNKKGEKMYRSSNLILLPEDLQIMADVKSFPKNRGIYTAILYNAKVKMTGYFSRRRLQQTLAGGSFSNMRLSLTVSDTRGLNIDADSRFNGNVLEFVPGSRIKDFTSGVNSWVSVAGNDEKIPFAIEMVFSGSSSLFFNPTAKRMLAKIQSNWPSPKFDGAYLPTQSKINKKGFSAEYQISWLGRSFDQVVGEDAASTIFSGRPRGVEEMRRRVEKSYSISDNIQGKSSFGVGFILTADHYQKTERSVKYGILFLTLTFGAFFLSEILLRLRLHPIQYLMIGSVLVIFYLLLISLSEHIPFAYAYVVSVLASSLAVAAYSFSILKKGMFSLIPALLLTALYAFLYMLLQSEDYALLIGSVLLFTILTAAMYLTRKIDWYSVHFDE